MTRPARPIIFSAPMVRALINGRKTQMRRVLKPQPRYATGHDNQERWYAMPNGGVRENCYDLPYTPGDRLWVRETWSGVHAFRDVPPAKRVSIMTPDGPILREDIWYWADGNPSGGDYERSRPPVHMPRWASRLTLTVTGVEVERLQDFSHLDAQEEGWPGPPAPWPTDWFRELWRDTHGPGSWSENPWVAAITFTAEKRNIDA